MGARVDVQMAAGTCGGMASILVCHPLDTIRTPSAFGGGGAWSVAAQTVRSEGALALYKGLSGPLLAQGAYKAVMFGVYGKASSALRRRAGGRELRTGEVFWCGAAAGGANAAVLAPVELVRNRRQIARGAGPAPSLRAIAAAAAEGPGAVNAVRGLYRGLGATLARDVPGVGAYYAAFDLARRELPAGAGAGWRRNAAAGAVGGAAFWTLALPLDCLKARIQVGALPGGAAAALLAACRAPGGVAALYVGYASALARGVPGAAVVFAVYGQVEAELLLRT